MTTVNPPPLLIDCLHVDDEMWSESKRACNLRRQIHLAIGARDLAPRELDTLEVDRRAHRVHPNEPVTDSTQLDLGDVSVFFRLTQVGSFDGARELLNRGFYHMVIADAVDLSKGEQPGTGFDSYSGYRLLREIPWPTTQRLLYSQDYYHLHEDHRIDIAASEIGSYITAHPIIQDDDEAGERFRCRLRLMFASALKHAAVGGGRFWFRIIDKRNDYILAEIREKHEGCWLVLSEFRLQLFGKNSASPGPHVAHYVTFVWFLGYSRARLATDHDFLVPGARAAEQGVTFVSVRRTTS